jgi:hypothetical protein
MVHSGADGGEDYERLTAEGTGLETLDSPVARGHFRMAAEAEHLAVGRPAKAGPLPSMLRISTASGGDDFVNREGSRTATELLGVQREGTYGEQEYSCDKHVPILADSPLTP